MLVWPHGAAQRQQNVHAGPGTHLGMPSSCPPIECAGLADLGSAGCSCGAQGRRAAAAS